MNNVVKKAFSLFLVGVVAVSMFGFIAPTRVEAAEEQSRGTVKVVNCSDQMARVTIYFFCDKLENYPVEIPISGSYSHEIPVYARTVVIKADIFKEDKWVNIDFLKFKVNRDNVYSTDVISTIFKDEKVVSMYTSGWTKLK